MSIFCIKYFVEGEIAILLGKGGNSGPLGFVG